MNRFEREGILFVVSGPSGIGKSTICSNLKQSPDFQFSISCTTRPPRRGEQNGVDYWFLSEADFDGKVERNEFLEWAHVHRFRYGTLKAATREAIESGVDLLLDIDVQGARQVRTNTEPWIVDALVDIFIMPPTIEELERRLTKRATENTEQIRIRIEAAQREIEDWPDYRYTILSETMEEDLLKARAIIRAERYRSNRLRLRIGTPHDPPVAEGPSAIQRDATGHTVSPLPE